MAAPGYQSPYYKQSEVGPQPPVHRTPWVLIISAVVGLVVVMAGCGTAIALLANKGASQVSTTGIKPSQVPSPSPAGTPKPTASPSASPTPISSGPTTSNTGVAFVLPKGWAVASQDDQSITVTDPSGAGSVTIGSGASSPAQTAVQNKATVDKLLQGKYPDTKDCANTQTTTGTLNGESGIFWVLCFTLASGGQSVEAGAPLFAGANSSGSVYYLVMLLTSQSNLDAFVKEAAPLLQSIQWKLT